MRVLSSFLAIAVVGIAAFLLLRAPVGAADGPPAPPKPGPEHEILKQIEGVWTAAKGLVRVPAERSPEWMGRRSQVVVHRDDLVLVT